MRVYSLQFRVYRFVRPHIRANPIVRVGFPLAVVRGAAGVSKHPPAFHDVVAPVAVIAPRPCHLAPSLPVAHVIATLKEKGGRFDSGLRVEKFRVADFGLQV